MGGWRAPGLLGLAAGALLGVGTPALVYSPGDLASAVVSALAVLGGVTVAVVGIGEMEALPGEGGAQGEIVRAYVARQKAMLEQLDETLELLREIRDALRAGVGEG